MTVEETACEVARWWPLLLAGLLVAGSLYGGSGGIEILAIIAILVIQAIWLTLWHGVPRLARKAGRAVGSHE